MPPPVAKGIKGSFLAMLYPDRAKTEAPSDAASTQPDGAAASGSKTATAATTAAAAAAAEAAIQAAKEETEPPAPLERKRKKVEYCPLTRAQEWGGGWGEIREVGKAVKQVKDARLRNPDDLGAPSFFTC